jgi:hypothetical protein
MPNSTSSGFDSSVNNEPKQIEEATGSGDNGTNCMDGPAAANALQPLPLSQLWTIMGAVSLAGFLYSLDITIITTVSFPRREMS